MICLYLFHLFFYSLYLQDSAKRWGAIITILLIWFGSVLIGLPMLVYSMVEQKEYIHFVSYSMCLEHWPSRISRLTYASIVMILQFVGPIGVLFVIHWKICNYLKCRIRHNPITHSEMNRAVKEAKRHRKNSMLLMTIAVMFALCWFPLTLVNLLADYNYVIFMHRNFLLAFAIAHMFAMVSACLNPIIYGWFNSNFRREFSGTVCFWNSRSQDDNIENRQLMAQEPSPEAAAPNNQHVLYPRRVCILHIRFKCM